MHVDPHVFAHVVAVAESLVTLGLLFGAFSNLTNLGGALLSFVIWSVAEGFGGSYTGGSADISAGIIYVLVFAALCLTNAGRYVGIDHWLTLRLGRFRILASPNHNALA